MKLKNMLIMAFLILTFIPVVVLAMLLYNNSVNLSKESYVQNLAESVNIQVDFVSQTLESNMIFDQRFVSQGIEPLVASGNEEAVKTAMLKEFQSYLRNSEDRISVCMLLDKDNQTVYSIGEQSMLKQIQSQLSSHSNSTQQQVVELDLNGNYTLGIITNIYNKAGEHSGSLISVYDRSFLFKTISSYYEIADSYTYMCRGNGDVLNLQEQDNTPSFQGMLTEKNGEMDLEHNKVKYSSYYKTINHSPWYLVGTLDNALIFAFVNRFVWVYILIIALVFVLDVILAVYFSSMVVSPINGLIRLMDGYPESLEHDDPDREKINYVEAKYLHTKFLDLMRTILLVQHNFEGVYQLYQSNAMDDTNIDIDTIGQTIQSNKDSFTKLINEIEVPEDACIVARFTNCFCKQDRDTLWNLFVDMRDNHLATAQEIEVFTPYLGEKWFHILAVPMYRDDRLSNIFIQLRDISSFKKQEYASLEQALHEPLTGLYNRKGFANSINTILDETDANLHALLFVDMNYFKPVNDNFGHNAGDQLLIQVAGILEKIAGNNGILARIGGDEFAMFLPNTTDEIVEATIDEVTSGLVFPYKSDEVDFTVTASVGCAKWTKDKPLSLEEMLSAADDEMYENKRAFKHNR